MIRKYHLDSPLNIFKMTQIEWYTLLLEENCTMEVVGDRGEFIRGVGQPRDRLGEQLAARKIAWTWT